MDALSTEAKVIMGTYFGIIMTSELSFARPQAIHPKMRKGLSDLVAAGYLTEKPRNDVEGCPVDFRPTNKMQDEHPGKDISMDFLKEHSFPVTVD